MSIETLGPGRPPWEEYVRHLTAAGQARWVLDDDARPSENVHFLAAMLDGRVIGSLSLLERVIAAPATDWSGGVETPLAGADGEPLRELFVQTFHVDEPHRRRGHGRSLQRAALELAKELGCVQVRSWSSVDRPGNYALKLGLGFAMDPATQVTPGGLEVSGVYFVKRVD